MILKSEVKVTSLEQLLEMLWIDYTELNPSVKNVFQLFSAANEKVVNDHVAFRTFNYPEMNIDVLSQTFLKFGYEYKDDYHFEEKKLYAKHFEHQNPLLPKIFISEFRGKYRFR